MPGSGTDEPAQKGMKEEVGDCDLREVEHNGYLTVGIPRRSPLCTLESRVICKAECLRLGADEMLGGVDLHCSSPDSFA